MIFGGKIFANKIYLAGTKPVIGMIRWRMTPRIVDLSTDKNLDELYSLRLELGHICLAAFKKPKLLLLKLSLNESNY